MIFTISKKKKIEEIIENSIIKKFKAYKPETINMPFHYRLLGKDRMALFSFIHSLNTTFGTSIFEPVAEEVAKIKFVESKSQFVVGNKISELAQKEIQNIINKISIAEKIPDKISETEIIRKVCRQGHINKIKTVKVDLYIKNSNNEVYLFDLKTAKPNISNFKDFKRTLLEWIAIYLFKEPQAKVNTCLAIPYNPYEPKPYERWTLKGMIDIKEELKVAEEFWDFLGGKGTYQELLDCFEKVGIKLRPKIDKYFSQFK
ncbi:MAG: TdeIII family type II restriction endonuclease [Candidatus Goldbacteria bacterium]|nr:TdeIII family type II restriction endonuclease [Candidatus Goldiibacteriota bacterium]